MMKKSFGKEENMNQEIKLTHSGILSKNGKPMVSVRFERGSDFAEGSVPECIIINKQGFTSEEICGLESYMKENAKELLRMAKDISGIKHWF